MEQTFFVTCWFLFCQKILLQGFHLLLTLLLRTVVDFYSLFRLDFWKIFNLFWFTEAMGFTLFNELNLIGVSNLLLSFNRFSFFWLFVWALFRRLISLFTTLFTCRFSWICLRILRLLLFTRRHILLLNAVSPVAIRVVIFLTVLVPVRIFLFILAILVDLKQRIDWRGVQLIHQVFRVFVFHVFLVFNQTYTALLHLVHTPREKQSIFAHGNSVLCTERDIHGCDFKLFLTWIGETLYLEEFLVLVFLFVIVGSIALIFVLIRLLWLVILIIFFVWLTAILTTTAVFWALFITLRLLLIASILSFVTNVQASHLFLSFLVKPLSPNFDLIVVSDGNGICLRAEDVTDFVAFEVFDEDGCLVHPVGRTCASTVVLGVSPHEDFLLWDAQTEVSTRADLAESLTFLQWSDLFGNIRSVSAVEAKLAHIVVSPCEDTTPTRSILTHNCEHVSWPTSDIFHWLYARHLSKLLSIATALIGSKA